MSRPLLVLTAMLSAGPAFAYPHFQIASGSATCQSCHHAPAGGGQLTEFGRDQSEDPLSTFGGNGGLLHGLVRFPRWISIGGDARLAALLNDNGGTEGVRAAAFPMQADLSVRAGVDAISATVVLGYRGSARRETLQPGSDLPPEPLPFVSREHFLTVRIPKTPLYLRAGRFFAPYGLRLADHTAYVRRALDFNLEQETYGASAGSVTEDWEIHGTAFALEPLRSGGPKQLGGAALAELRIGTNATVGLSGRLSFSDSGTRRLIGGPLVKLYLEELSLLWMGELDIGHQRFGGGLPSRYQLVAYGGPVWTPVQGVSVGVAYEAFAEDLAVPATARHALGGWISFLPWAHLEAMLSTRVQQLGTADRAWNVLAQLHYYL